MTEHETDRPEADFLPYATPMPRSRLSARWEAVVVALSGLELIFLGGWLLTGVIAKLSNGPSTVRRDFLVGVLYVGTFSCLAGAAWLLILAVGRLLRISRGE